MPSPTRQERLDELDALLRSEGLDVYEVAKRWQVQPDWVRHYLTALRNAGAQIDHIYLGPGERLYFYTGGAGAKPHRPRVRK